MLRSLVRRQLILVAVLTAQVAVAGEMTFAPNDVRPVVRIVNDIDTREVHYGIHLDEQCRPGKKPIFGFRREGEPRERFVTFYFFDPLAYAVKHQETKSPTEVWFEIRAYPRPIQLLISKNPTTNICAATAFTTINGKRSRLDQIFLSIKSQFSIHWLELRGHEVETGKENIERVYP